MAKKTISIETPNGTTVVFYAAICVDKNGKSYVSYNSVQGTSPTACAEVMEDLAKRLRGEASPMA